MLFPVAYAGLVFRPFAAAACAVISLTELVALAVAGRNDCRKATGSSWPLR